MFADLDCGTGNLTFVALRQGASAIAVDFAEAAPVATRHAVEVA